MRLSLRVVAFIFALTIAAALALYCASLNGIGFSHDSAFFLSARRTGLLTRSTWWPPAYPAVLALADCLGLSTQECARWLNLGLFAGIVALMAAGAYLSTGRRYVMVAFGLLALVSPALWYCSLMAATEPPCIFFGLAALVLLQKSPDRPLQGVALACLALANLTRYAAVAYTAAAWLVWLPRYGFRKATALAIVAVLPLLLWLLGHRWAGSPSARSLGFHPPPTSEVLDALSGLSLWLVPAESGRWSLAFIPLLLLVLPALRAGTWPARTLGLALTLWGFSQADWTVVLAGLLLGALLARRTEPAPVANANIHVCFILAYALVVLLSRTLADENLALDERMLCVLWPSAALWGATVLARSRQRLELFIPLCMSLVLIGVSTAQYAFFRAWAARVESRGFGTPEWRQSALVKSVQDLPAGTLLFTNEPAPFLLHTRLNPLWFDQDPKSPDYRSWLSWGEKELKAEGGYYAYLAPPIAQRPPLKDLAPLLNWRLLRSCPQGRLYYIPKARLREGAAAP